MRSKVLVTGGTGSFGQAFIDHILRECPTLDVVVFSRDELKQAEARARFGNDPRIRWVLGDVRSYDDLRRAMHGVVLVVHAAALKHVDSAERNPWQYVQTNIIGSQNVISAAIDAGVHKVVALSTDKASSPINLYGATKLCADKLFRNANHTAAAHRTRFAVVRYGNVFGSRGSVVPFFLDLGARGEPLPITDMRCTRFIISMSEAVRTVVETIEFMQGGELVVPAIPSVGIEDLALGLVPGAALVEVGLRPGEKLHEEMISVEEGQRCVMLPGGRYFVIEPELDGWGYETPVDAMPVVEGFVLRSDTNSRWYARSHIRAMAEEAVA